MLPCARSLQWHVGKQADHVEIGEDGSEPMIERHCQGHAASLLPKVLVLKSLGGELHDSHIYKPHAHLPPLGATHNTHVTRNAAACVAASAKAASRGLLHRRQTGTATSLPNAACFYKTFPAVYGMATCHARTCPCTACPCTASNMPSCAPPVPSRAARVVACGTEPPRISHH